MHPGPLRRTVAQPCEKYFVKVAALHERIRAMRTEDMTMRAIVEREGVSTRAPFITRSTRTTRRAPRTPPRPPKRTPPPTLDPLRLHPQHSATNPGLTRPKAT